MSFISTSSKSNPFYQPAKQWQIRIYTHRDIVLAVEESFEDLARATLSFEVNEAIGEWCIDIITDISPENANIEARLSLTSGLLNISTPRFDVHPLEPKDWVGEVERNFPPLHVGKFYVHGSHVDSTPPHGKIALQINAGAAFGSGEHATTSGCLLALSKLSKRRKYKHPLDMGCGSGILALAVAKLWNVYTIGVDIDPVSVTVAKENACDNQLHRVTQFVAGNGYSVELVRKQAPFDLIIANILARPLMKMAPDLANNLASGGTAILSGLLASQERMVLAAHRTQGLKLATRICQNGWNTLVLRKF